MKKLCDLLGTHRQSGEAHSNPFVTKAVPVAGCHMDLRERPPALCLLAFARPGVGMFANRWATSGVERFGGVRRSAEPSGSMRYRRMTPSPEQAAR